MRAAESPVEAANHCGDRNEGRQELGMELNDSPEYDDANADP